MNIFFILSLGRIHMFGHIYYITSGNLTCRLPSFKMKTKRLKLFFPGDQMKSDLRVYEMKTIADVPLIKWKWK